MINLLDSFIFNQNIWLRTKSALYHCGEPININSVLVTFKLSLFAINQFLRFCKSDFTAFSISVIEEPEAVRLVSSANGRSLVLLRQSVSLYNLKEL